VGKWYQALCGDTAPQDRHWVFCQGWAQLGQTPPVQKVFQCAPQAGVHAQRLSKRGFQRQAGQ
jgi:hypothetical protein